MVDTKINVLFGTATVASQPWRILRAGNVRVGKVSIEEILEACFRKSLMMRTRPRPSDVSREVRAGAKHRLHARSCGNLFLGSRAVMRTRPRLSARRARSAWISAKRAACTQKKRRNANAPTTERHKSRGEGRCKAPPAGKELRELVPRQSRSHANARKTVCLPLEFG